ncbi:MAG: type II toxin-antitoxin system Phd/YefM family antitoxin [Kiritimatiellae bacterium]|nr:type II toxin-antitoxin system Phd/YefM family antitoxin [Kiritimatiellia bacterium]
MPDFKPTEDIISMSEFRTTLADCVARTAETHRPIILTQNGRASSVFLSAADWEKICQKLYDAEIYEDILVSEGESERGEVYTHDEVKRMIEADLKKLAKERKATGKRSPKNRKVA